MTIEDMFEIYNEYAESSQFYDFRDMPEEQKLHKREDIHAFLLLDKIYDRIPSKNKEADILQAAEHDMIYLSHDLDNIAAVITKEEILSLAKGGVCFSEDDGLYMFV